VSREVNLIGGYTDAADWISRFAGVANTSAGFEYFERLSGDTGDFLTLNLQARAAYDDSRSSGEAWGVEVHNAWADWKLGLGSTLRVGHFDPAFGLEPVTDTHGTLLQTLMPRQLGYKKDWGVSWRGFWGDYDLQLAGQLGSGMGIARRDGSFLASARAGTPPGGDAEYGLSLLYGEVLKAEKMRTIPYPGYLPGGVLKKRLGLDGKLNYGSWSLMGEGALGSEDGRAAAGFMARGEYVLPEAQAWSLAAQADYWDIDLGGSRPQDVTVTAQVSYEMSPVCTIRAAYFHDLESRSGAGDQGVIFQCYLYGF